MIRLFVALALPANVRARLSTLQSGLAGARWVDADSMHVTLRFVGCVTEPDARDIALVLSDIRDPVFDLTINGLGYFDRRGYGRSVWARVEKSRALVHLQSGIERAMVRCGCDPETRKFTPHITLGRLRDTPVDRIGSWLENAGTVVVPPFQVNAFMLFRSDPGHGGAKYTVLDEYDLTGYNPGACV